MAKRKRATRFKVAKSLMDLLSTSFTPLLLVDSDRRVVFANRSLADWVGLSLDRIAGRLVEYHSEPTVDDLERQSPEVITGLCPPPAALAGNRVRGTLSCLGRDGRLRHRRSEFLPLEAADGFAVLALLESRDLAPAEIASSMATTEADALHRQLRQLRRDEANRYSIASLVGESAPLKQIRAQVTAAARSRAHTLIMGRRGSGRSHVARAIHFTSAAGPNSRIVYLDCRLLMEEQLRRGLDSLQREQSSTVPTLLLAEIDQLERPFQKQLVGLLQPRERECQIIATVEFDLESKPVLDAELAALIATISIELPPLATRREDLPLLVQLFLEEANVEASRQVGGASPEVLERLALYRWPGEIEELREVVFAAHARNRGHEIQACDLPDIVHHASLAAQFAELPTEEIALDEFMAGIERELLLRALERAQGNKAHAARLLGMTRPRLYRRLVQLDLVGDSAEGLEIAGEEPADED